MNLTEYALSELERALAKGDSYNELIKEAVMELVELFGEQGHSGYSAPIVLDIFSRLANYKPLSPLTGEESEWSESFFSTGETQQNNRCFDVFRTNGDNSTAYTINGKYFSKDGGKTWFTSKDSHVHITFPYVPKEPERVILSETPDDIDEPQEELTVEKLQSILGEEVKVVDLTNKKPENIS